MTKNSISNNNQAAKVEELCDLLSYRYAFGCDLDAQESFLNKVAELIASLDIAAYDECEECFGSFDKFVVYYMHIAHMFMWRYDAIDFICKQFETDAAEVFNDCDIDPFSDPGTFAWRLFIHMLYKYIDFGKLEAYARRQA